MRFLENSDGKLVGCLIEHVAKGKYKTILNSRWQPIHPFFSKKEDKNKEMKNLVL